MKVKDKELEKKEESIQEISYKLARHEEVIHEMQKTLSEKEKEHLDNVKEKTIDNGEDMTTDQLTNNDDDLNNEESKILQIKIEIETLSPLDSVTKKVSSFNLDVDDNGVDANDDIANKDEIVNQTLNKKEATQKSIKMKTKCQLCESTFKVAFGV